MTPAELGQGVEQRLAATVHAFGGPQVIAGPLPWPPMPAGALAGLPPGRRAQQGVVLHPVPGADLFAIAAGFWQQGGCHVGETAGAFGRTLVGHDPAGYLLALEQRGDTTILAVASPPGFRRDHHLGLGIGLGVLVAAPGPCLSVSAALRPTPEADGAASGLVSPWLWLPVLLVLAAFLITMPGTRRFGTGLLIGTATTGIIVSGTCTAMIT